VSQKLKVLVVRDQEMRLSTARKDVVIVSGIIRLFCLHLPVRLHSQSHIRIHVLSPIPPVSPWHIFPNLVLRKQPDSQRSRLEDYPIRAGSHLSMGPVLSLSESASPSSQHTSKNPGDRAGRRGETVGFV